MSRFLLGLLATTALSAQASFEIEGRYWFSQVNSRLRVEYQGLGTDIDGKNDLGFTDSGIPEARAAVRWGHNQVQFVYTPISFSGDRVVTRTLIFNGRTYTFGTRVVSGLEAKHLQIGFTHYFSLHHGLVKLGPMVEAHGFLLSGTLQAPAVNANSKEDLSVGIPAIGPSLEISPHRQVDIYGEASGMSAGDYGHFIRGEAGVRIRPVRFLQLTAGYQTFNLRLANSSDFARLHLRGPFVGAGLRW
jgi:hypothetical protein